ncbi:MAG: ABC transporter substrate-binding protein [Zoogloeaceae bacterium]|nr:ABC transporter substrate-binding protein [Zoogloeaceae bacterium]
MKPFFSLLFSTMFLLLAPGVGAQEPTPDGIVQSVTEEVLKILREDKDIQAGNLNKIGELVDAKVLPHFNFRRMTQLAVGREWRQASAAQQNELVQQFRDLLLRTYGNAVVSYRDQKFVYKPLKMKPDETDVQVRTEIVQPGGTRIQIDYSMEKKDQGWKVYDVVVGGISLVTNYRETFAQEIRAGGIDGLIRALSEKNKAPAKQEKA